MRTPLTRTCFACIALLLLTPRAFADQPLKLHVPSPDWRAQIIYFLMIDRFDDGDPANNRQGQHEFAPADSRKYSGGDLAGIKRKLDYIQGLGASAIWITPPVKHQWWDGRTQYGGYHGYWAQDFDQVDPHFGSLLDYQRLSDALHRRGMYLVQDIVLNHTGNFSSYGDRFDAADPTVGFELNRQSEPLGPPAPPLDRNDVRNPAHRKAALYHWTPSVRDFKVREQELTYQLADLDDLNTRNPVVRQHLRRAYGSWIKRVGVDAFRIDTVFYVEPESLVDFLQSKDQKAPGILQVARATGRANFLNFGEGFGIDPPFADAQSLKIKSYLERDKGVPVLPSMLNFPLYGSVIDVYTRAMPTQVLAHRIASMRALYPNLGLMPSFIDNHDVDRFLSTGNQTSLKQALLTIMTLPGIPVIYYGTEQGFKVQRQAMFGAGFGAGDKDHFDTAAPLYRFIQRLSKLRLGERTLTHGTPKVLASNQAGAGVLAYAMSEGDAQSLVLINSATDPVLLDNLATGWPAGSVLEPVFSIDGTPPAATVQAAGRLTLVLPGSAGWVLRAAKSANAPAPAAALVLTLDPLANSKVQGDFDVQGHARGATEIELVLDGELNRAQPIKVPADGLWRARIDTRRLFDPAVEHRLVAFSRAHTAVSPAITFQIKRDPIARARASDAAGDDHGPSGRYVYPTDPGWGKNRQLDIRSASVSQLGDALKLSIQSAGLTQNWNPANGFDRVLWTVFFSLPARDDGIRELPLQNAKMPAGLRWQFRLRAGGWSNAWFSAEGASATNEGTLAAPGAKISVDQANNTVSFLLPPGALGPDADLDGLRIYITAWDFDARYRPLGRTPGPHQFGGGEPTDPLVMDDLSLILKPSRPKRP